MGNSVSQTPANCKEKSKSDAIDRLLEEEGRQFKKECKVLLLGLRGSGKSTLVKQMKIVHQNGYTAEELSTFRLVVYKNVLESAQTIVRAMRELDLQPVHPSNKVLANKIIEYKLDNTDPVLSPEIAKAIHVLVQDPVVPKILEHSSEFYLMDSAQYFFSEVLRICSPGYQPTVTDVLRARVQTTGISETRFHMGQLSIHMFDVGNQRSERRKWIHCFESVTSIIFCTALSEYDQVEVDGQNRMQESLVFFDSIINSRWFLRTSIILFLTKTDIFKHKLPRIPLERYFPEYIGGNDINKATRYILWKFMQTNRARLSVYPHLTQATDTSNIKLVFAAVKETILQNANKDSGIL